MKESSKVLIGVSIGLVAGGIAGYFLASDEGRAFQERTKEQFKKLEDDVKVGIKNNSEVVASKFTSASESAKAWATDVSETVKNKIGTVTSKVEEVTEDVQSDFERGVENARRKIEGKVESKKDIIGNV